MPLSGPGFDAAIATYAAAFAEPPYRDRDRGADMSQRLVNSHRKFSGFWGVAALSPTGETLGMIYGYTSKRGQWWHDSVRAIGGEVLAREWLADAAELAEVAVHPKAQSSGLGTALVTAFEAARTEHTSLLSTRKDSRAHLLYRRLGYDVLFESPFVQGGLPFYVMGKRLR
ncbi:MAG: GNAT family N-acetyltransferase [Dehalococcoidia bacterium]